MANINWPIATSVGQLYTSDNGSTWQWTGTYWETINVGGNPVSGGGLDNQVALWNGQSSVFGSPRILYSDVSTSNVKLEINDLGFGSSIGRGYLKAFANNQTADLMLTSGNSSATSSPTVQLIRYKNTIDIPQPVTIGDYLGQIQFKGTQNNAGLEQIGANIFAQATETWSSLSTLRGTKFVIQTAANGGALSEKFSIGGDGLIKFYNTYTFPNVNGTSGQYLKTDGSGTLSWGTISPSTIGALSGSGTDNYVSKWNVGGTSLIDSQILDNGSSLSIGTTLDSSRKLLVFTNSQTNAVAGFNTSTGTGTKYGIDGQSYGANGTNVGGRFAASSGTNNYSVVLQDGTQTLDGGKFLKDMGDGKANWSFLTTADVSGSITGSGLNNRIALWSGPDNISYSDLYKWETQSGDGTLLINGSQNTARFGAYGSGILSTGYSQFRLSTINTNSSTHPIFTLSHGKGTTASPGYANNGYILGTIVWSGYAGNSAIIQSVATQDHELLTARGAKLEFLTTDNSNNTDVRLSITSDGSIKFNEAYTFPKVSGTLDQTLKVDNSGNLYWAPSLSGSGTINYIPKWSSSTGNLSNSQIRDNGSNIGIGDDPFSLAKVYINGAGFRDGLYSVAGTNGNYGVRGSSQTHGLSTNTGIYGEAYNQQGPSVGVEGYASASNLTGATVIGGAFTATGSTSGSNYSLRLMDGTQGAGKFLKSIDSLGHANWATLTAADISGVLSGGGSTNKMAFWSSGSNLTYNNNISRYTTGTHRTSENGISVQSQYSLLKIEGNSINIEPLPDSTFIPGDTYRVAIGSTGVTNPELRFTVRPNQRPTGSNLGSIGWYMTNYGATESVQLASIKVESSNSMDGSFGYVGSAFKISTAIKDQSLVERIAIDYGQNAVAGVSPWYAPSVRIKNDSNLIIGTGNEVSSKLISSPTVSGYHQYGLEIHNKGLFISTYQGQLNNNNYDIYGAKILANSYSASGYENTGVYVQIKKSPGINVGIKADVTSDSWLGGDTAANYAGWFSVIPGATSFALRLQDGYEGTGKYLRSEKSDGSARWANVNVSEVVGAVGGVGTPNRLSKWTVGGTTLTNSSVRDNGSSLSIGVEPISNVKLFIGTGSGYDTSGHLYGLWTVNASIDSMAILGQGNYIGVKGDANGWANTTSDNIGVYGAASNNSNTNIGGKFSAGGTSGNKYSVQLTDGTEGDGKFLRSDGLGRANWSTLSVSNITGAQSTLVSGTNIKTVNSQTLLGSGNLTVQETLVSGTNIKTVNGQTLLGSGNLTLSGGTGTVGSSGPITQSLAVWKDGPNQILGGSEINYYQGSIGLLANPTTGSGITAVVGANPSHAFGMFLTLNNNGIGIYSQNTTIGPNENVGVYAFAGGSTSTNTGVRGYANPGVGATSIGGHFWAPNGSTAYAVQLQDASSSIPGKFLKNMTNEGHARWQSITVSDVSGAQESLVSGTNIKTVNSQTLLGSGNLTVQATLVSGTNIKTVNSQTLLGSGDLAVQDTLVSGTNIKTVNSQTLLGSGDLAVQDTLVSGTNIKTVNSQSILGSGDLAVQATLVSGTNIKTVNGQSLLGSGNITISGGSLSGGVIYTIPVWSGSSSLGNSVIKTDGSDGIGINNIPLTTITTYVKSTRPFGISVSCNNTSTNTIFEGQAISSVPGDNIGLYLRAENAQEDNIGITSVAKGSGVTGATSTAYGITAFASLGNINIAGNFNSTGFAGGATSIGLKSSARGCSVNYGLYSDVRATVQSSDNIGGYFLITDESGITSNKSIGIASKVYAGTSTNAYFAQFTKVGVDSTNKAVLSDNADGYADWGKVTSSYTQGASGTFTSADGKTVTVTNGLITSIV